MYWFAHDTGAAGPTPPLLHQIERRIAAEPELTAATARVFNHELRPSEVFTPALSFGAMVTALRENRGRRMAILREAGTALANEFRRRRAARRLSRRR
jgi:hypothetical protein